MLRENARCFFLFLWSQALSRPVSIKAKHVSGFVSGRALGGIDDELSKAKSRRVDLPSLIASFGLPSGRDSFACHTA